MYVYEYQQEFRKCLKFLFPNISDNAKVTIKELDNKDYKIKYRTSVRIYHQIKSRNLYYRIPLSLLTTFLISRKVSKKIIRAIYDYQEGLDIDIKSVNNYLKKKNLNRKIFDYFLKGKDNFLIAKTKDNYYIERIYNLREKVAKIKVSSDNIVIGPFTYTPYHYQKGYAVLTIKNIINYMR